MPDYPTEKPVSPLERNKALAIAAKEYVQNVIKWGKTGPVFHTLDKDAQRRLDQDLGRLRTAAVSFSEVCVELDRHLDLYYKTAEMAKQLKIGNCGENAVLALDYVVRNASDVDAEVYLMQGYDHAFLVIGRDPQSDPVKPEPGVRMPMCAIRGGGEAHPAEELTRPKAYQSTDTKYSSTVLGDFSTQVVTTEFNPEKHTLEPNGKLNTQHVRTSSTGEHINALINLHQKKSDLILLSLNNLSDNLGQIAKEITQRYGAAGNKQVSVLYERINEIHEKIADIEQKQKAADTLSSVVKPRDNTPDKYLEISAKLRDSLQHSVAAARTMTEFTALQQATLSESQEGAIAKFLRSFSKEPNFVPEKAVERAIHKTSTSLQSLSDFHAMKKSLEGLKATGNPGDDIEEQQSPDESIKP